MHPQNTRRRDCIVTHLPGEWLLTPSHCLSLSFWWAHVPHGNETTQHNTKQNKRYFVLLFFSLSLRVYSWKQKFTGRLESSSSSCCSCSSFNISKSLGRFLHFLNLNSAKIFQIHLLRTMCTCQSTLSSQKCAFQPLKIKTHRKIAFLPFEEHDHCYLTTCWNSTARNIFGRRE